MNRLLIFILLILGMSSCEKEELPGGTTQGNLSFYFDGDIDSKPVVFVAGENDIYMNTKFIKDSPYIEMNGTFSVEDTSVVDSFLSISFFADGSSSFSPNTYFSQQYFSNYSNNSVHYFDVTFMPYQINTKFQIDSFLFLFGDSSDYKGYSMNAFTHRYNLEGTYLLQEEYYFNGKPNAFETELKLVTGKACYPQLKLADTSEYPNYYFEVEPSNLSNFNVVNLISGAKYSTINFTIDTGSLKTGQNQFRLESFSAGCENIFDLDLYADAIDPSPLFTYSVFEFNAADDPNNSVKIVYKKDGKTYSSDALIKRKILDVTKYGEYITNKYGQKTYSIEAAIDGFLYNVNSPSDSIPIKSKKLVFAVAIP